jgi:DNA-nicking Smr family endonuclease
MTWFKILSRAPKPDKRENAPAKVAKKTKPKRNPLSAEDHAIWSEVARSVAPLPGRVLPEVTTAPPSIHVEASTLTAQPAGVAAPLGSPSLPPLARLEKRTLRALARGRAEIEGRIDLHGMRQSEAHGALNTFLHRAHHRGEKLVLVITGKGGGLDANGEERGVLRRLVPHWLADPVLRRLVVGYESAARGHGGEGALYVRLRRKRDT